MYVFGRGGGTYVVTTEEVKGQLSNICSLLSLFRFWNQTHVIYVNIVIRMKIL